MTSADAIDDSSLASRVEDLAEQLAVLRAEVAGLSTMAKRVGTLADRVAELAVARSEGTGVTALTSWFDADAGRASSDLVELTHWVYGVLSHYRVASQEFTDCWFQHPAAVEGLLALRAAWYVAYRSPGGRPESASDWHIRLLPGLAGLLREELRACSETNHAPNGEIERYRLARLRVLPDDQRLRTHAVWWATDHALRGVSDPS
jgi:hypothetical protein